MSQDFVSSAQSTVYRFQRFPHSEPILVVVPGFLFASWSHAVPKNNRAREYKNGMVLDTRLWHMAISRLVARTLVLLFNDSDIWQKNPMRAMIEMGDAN